MTTEVIVSTLRKRTAGYSDQMTHAIGNARMLDAMTRSRPLRRFDPFRPIDMLTSLWSSAAVAPVSSGAAAAYRTLFMTVRRLVVGRRLAVRLDDGDLTLTVTEFDSRLDVRGLSVGQLNDVRLAARDIRWDGSNSTAPPPCCTTCTCGRPRRRCWWPHRWS